MKSLFYACLIGTASLTYASDSYAQTTVINLNVQNQSVEEVLDQIEKKTDFTFFYNTRHVDLNRRVSVSANETNIFKILDTIFADSDVSYQVVDKKIVLSKKDILRSAVVQQSNIVKGTVVDPNGDPVIGANIVVKGTTNGTITDMDGNFSLSAPQGSTLVVSYIGFSDYIVKVGNQKSLAITLKEDSKALEEVVVVGYGTQKKVNLTGAVSAVSGEDMAKRPIVNVATMLQGQVPGLRVNQGTGQPGSENTSFRIRGQGTYSGAGSDPLVLINGVQGDISNLDPGMIESVSVLKDAASASIYGARAANGVILVTTKQGAGSGDNKAHIAYHGNVAFYSPTNMYDLVTNSVEYMELYNIAKVNNGMPAIYTQEMIDAYRNGNGSEQYPNFDWLDYMFNTATVQNHNLSISGNAGKERKTTYNIALNFVDQPGTLRGFEYQKYNATLDLTSDVTDFIKVGTYASMMYGDRKEPRQGQADSFLSTLAQAPTYMPWLPDDGTGIKRWTYSAYNFENHNKNMPAIIADDATRKYQNYDINAQLWLDIKLFKGLHWYTKGAVRLQTGKSKDWIGSATPVYNYHTGEVVGDLDKGGLGMSVGDSKNFYTNFYTYLKYDISTQNKYHDFSLMAGYSQESEKFETLGGYRKYFAFDLPVLNAGATSEWSNYGSEGEWALRSIFGRFNYSFRNRYLFEANMRYDGTSRIASENRWGIFPSFSAGWRLTEEDFIKNLNWTWLNNVKIRGSWGQLGNQNIGLYPYQAMISHVQDYPFDKTNLTNAYQQTAYANRDIKWETTTITDVGFDATLFNGLNITFDWYNKLASDILRSSQVSGLLGLSAPIINDGEMRNRGIELSLNYSNTIHGGFFDNLHYSIGGYIDRNRNKLVSFGAEEISDRTILREGLPYGQYHMLECIGVFADENEIKNAPKQFNDDVKPGDLRYKDQNNDGVIDYSDRIPISGQFPAFEYGINASLDWNGFDVSLIGQGVADKKYYTETWGVQPFFQGTAPSRDYLKGMWTEENPYNAKHPKLYEAFLGGTKNIRPNSYFLRNASFFRLRNFTLGYTLPKNLTDKVRMSKVRVYFSGDNLITFTKYSGLDPERSGDGLDAQYPQNKICSFGLNVEF